MSQSSTGYFRYHGNSDIQAGYIQAVHTDSEEIKLEPITASTKGRVIKKQLAMEPVYVDVEGRLVYNSVMMEKGKQYPILWNNEDFILMKDDYEVSIYKLDREPQ